MKQQIQLFLGGLLLFFLNSCIGQPQFSNELTQAERYLELKPDSALLLLEKIPSENIINKSERAKYALLLSMALDKNYIDKTDFESLDPARQYYKNHGTPTEKMRTKYYEGRIYSNALNDSSAMRCYLDALTFGERSDDLLTKARTLFSQGIIYANIYDWESYIRVNKLAAILFQRAGYANGYAHSILGIVNAYVIKEDRINAKKYLSHCDSVLSELTTSMLSNYYANYLNYFAKFQLSSSVDSTAHCYQSNISHELIDWLTIANAYLTVSNVAEAHEAIMHYTPSEDNTSEDMRYYLLLSMIQERQQLYKESLSSFQKHTLISDSINYVAMKADTQFSAERHALEMQHIREKENKNITIIVAIGLAVLLILTVLLAFYFFRLEGTKKKLAIKEKERYFFMYQKMEAERDNLSNLLSHNHEINENARLVVLQRLALLNDFFKAQITDSKEVSRKITQSMNKLVANADDFMSSSRLAYLGSHPQFIKFLEDKGLTEWEIGYCCLYALGLKGKEIGIYIKMPGHYNISSSIRGKLGLGEHDTNLGSYIQQLLQT